nr:alpha/beta hydrolase [uncultured Desulfuromonas sp.]
MKKRLILFPGLAADERMYQDVSCSVCELVTPRLLVPKKKESMQDYARRCRIQLSIGDDDIIGGCSFGSLVASEIVRQQPCRGLILLSGAHSSQSLVSHAGKLNQWAKWIPYPVIRQILVSRPFLERVFGGGLEAHLQLGRSMLIDAPARLVREGGRLAVSYFPDEEIRVPIFALHGALDQVINVPMLPSTTIVEDAGHGLVVSHARKVSQFLDACCLALR